jgi:hypothetical protein
LLTLCRTKRNYALVKLYTSSLADILEFLQCAD